MQINALMPLSSRGGRWVGWAATALLALAGCDDGAEPGGAGGSVIIVPPGGMNTADALPMVDAGGQGGQGGGQGGQGGGQGGQGGGQGGQGGGQGGQGGGQGGQGGGQGGQGGGQGGQGGGQGGQGGGQGGQGGMPVQAGALGSACEDNDDCDGGLCLGLPNGYCSQSCDDADCPAGGSCWNFGDAGQACLLNCEDSGDCRRNEGYVCDGDNTCYPGEAPAPPGDGDVGAPCAADGDCAGDGRCVTEAQDFPGGYCVVFGCSEESPCPGGSECFQLQGGDTVCLDLCRGADDCRDGYACRPDVGACMPGCEEGGCPDGTICTDEGLCEEPPCTPNSCDEGLICADSGRCVIDIGAVPDGPVPACNNMPDWRCEGGEAECGRIELFMPARGQGYWDYPANGETVNNPYRSWARRDGILLSKYAGALTECLSQNWNFGNGGEVCIGDCSEEDGGIPGASIGRPGHPQGTHTNGFDLDMGYYQVGTENNWMRSVCDHYLNGQDQYHCVGEPFALDPWRSALYLGLLHHSPQVRVIGVDGRIGPLIDSATDQLCEAGFLDGPACNRRTRSIAYEEEDAGRGWFRFHHHHWHISLSTRRAAGLEAGFGPFSGSDACLRADCFDAEWPAAAGLKRLPNMAERRFNLTTPARAAITTTWTPDENAIFHEIERLDAEDED